VGLLATKIAQDDDQQVEGYHVYFGGGFGDRRELAREVLRDVAANDVPATLERVLKVYLAQRAPGESFQDFAKRHSVEELRAFANDALEKAA
jgi:ferredoxin-nitrite reductase